MDKQIHIRLDKNIYETLMEHTESTNKTVQESVVEALCLFFNDKYKEKVTEDARFTFVDLFSGIGGMRLAFEA